MTPHDQYPTTAKNLDRLAQFLNQELEKPTLADTIPDSAHIFHGAYNDPTLTDHNVKMATNMLMGMVLGLREEAPLIMIYEIRPGQYKIIDLATAERKRQVLQLAETLHKQSQQAVQAEVETLLAG